MISGAPIGNTPLSGEEGGLVVFFVNVAETGNAQDTPVMSHLTVGQSVTETVHAADTTSCILTFNESVQEFAHAADTSHLPPGHVLVADFLHAADTASRTLILTAGVAEHGNARDVTRKAPPPHVHESGDAIDLINVAVNHNWHMRVKETGHAVDTPTATVFLHARVHEFGLLHDTVSEGVNGHFNVSIIESAAAWDSSSPHLIVRPFVNEHLNAIDHNGTNIGVPGHFFVSVVETANAVDTSIDPELFSSAGVFFWNYQWAYNEGITELAVWCGGLDCGNHPVDPSGFVFVPWQSDPDGLFTPNWLFGLENSPPYNGGFGASSCNIDLVANDGSVIRVITDLAIGVPYTSQLQVLRPNAPEQTHSQFGSGLGLTRRVERFAVQLNNTGPFSFGTTTDNQLPTMYKNPNGMAYLYSQLFSGVYRDFVGDNYSFEGQLLLEIERPYPMMVVALSTLFTTIDVE